MKMKNLCKLVFIIPALAGICFMAVAAPSGDSKDVTAVTQSNKAITVDKTVHDFGTITEADGPKSATFTVTNNTDTPVLITNARPSCGCTTPDWTKTPIEPGKTGTVTAKYDPKGHPGPFDKTVTIYTNGTPDRITVHITGTVQD
ncbi:MAG: DUF1573 domain-containing protein [Dysgonamonadaceae bacterium]|jgi:hypothetical protein|nr:DUF1573 domain-containing protein [Dysgonamonadaceae bacterium]